jgi:hypothetical protein
MKNMIQHLTRLGVVLVLAHGLSVAQEIKSLPPSDTSKDESSKITKADQEQEREMRREQLETLRVSTLTRTIDSIKKMDEPALRISARVEILKYLTFNTSPSEVDKTLAANIAKDALADLGDHADEIMPSLREHLFSSLGVWIRKYQPSLNEKLKTLERSLMKGKAQSIQALLSLPGGDVLAAQRLTQSLEAGTDIPVLVLYLNELIARNSKEVEPLLSKILEVAAQGRLSFETLLSVSDLYLQPQISPVLKRRFLVTVIARTQPFNMGRERVSESAYYLLTNLLPEMQQTVPELYSQAVNQRLVIYASFNREQVAAEERNKQLNENPSAVEGLIAEAEETKSKTRRNELLAEAAQLALDSKRFALCLEAVEKIDVEVVGIAPDFWKNWNDQFIREFVKATLDAKQPKLAAKGTGYVRAQNAKVESLISISQYWAKAHNNDSARRLLTQAREAADSATDSVEKAKAFLLLSATSDQADGTEKIELLESAIKALNSVSMPERGDDLKPYQKYAWQLNSAEYQLIRGFKDLAKKSNEEALILIEKIERPESRTFALLGILLGLRDLSLSKIG